MEHLSILAPNPASVKRVSPPLICPCWVAGLVWKRENPLGSASTEAGFLESGFAQPESLLLTLALSTNVVILLRHRLLFKRKVACMSLISCCVAFSRSSCRSIRHPLIVLLTQRQNRTIHIMLISVFIVVRNAPPCARCASGPTARWRCAACRCLCRSGMAWRALVGVPSLRR